MGMVRTPAVIASQQAAMLAKQGKFAEAIPFYEEALTLTPHVVLWSALAFARLMAGRYAEALSAYDKVVELDPGALRRGQTAAHIHRVSILADLKRCDEALAAADEMIAQAPRNSDSWVCRGYAYVSLKRYHDAEEALLTAIRLAPSNRLALGELTNFYRKNVRDFERATEVCERLLAIRPNDEYAWGHRGKILHDFNQYEEAVNAYERALECKADNFLIRAPNWRNYGLSLLYLGRCFDALVALDRSEALIPGREPNWNGRGVIHERIEQHAEALERYEAAIHADHLEIVPRINKAELLTYLGRYDEAESILSEVLAEEPESFGAWCVKGLLETRRKRHDEAMAAFRRSIELEPRHGPTYMELAALLLDLDDPEHAATVAERATTLDPYYARAWKVKAQALHAAGGEEEAAAAEQRGAELLADQTAQVEAYLRAKGQRDASNT